MSLENISPWSGRRALRGIRVFSLLLCCSPAIAQMPVLPETSAPAADVKLPVFDTVSVKENKGDSHMMRLMTKADGFESTNLPVSNLIAQAFGIRQDLITGLPDWAGSVPYDINAKVAEEDVPTLKKLNSRQRGAMLQPMLQERFKLQAYKETRTLPTYDLVVDKDGSKLTPSTAPKLTPGETPDLTGKIKRAGTMSTGRGRFTGTGLPLQTLVAQLASALHRTVIDKTGLTGAYDFELKWTPEEMAAANPDGDAEGQAGSIFTAVREQLGLRLVSSKGPVETVVVDHIEKPSEN